MLTSPNKPRQGQKQLRDKPCQDELTDPPTRAPGAGTARPRRCAPAASLRNQSSAISHPASKSSLDAKPSLLPPIHSEHHRKQLVRIGVNSWLKTLPLKKLRRPH